MNLFEEQNQSDKQKEPSPVSVPLATRMRPHSLNEFIGQQHILGKDDLLYKMISNGILNSVIFYGPPSSGKTTLAWVIAKEMNAEFLNLNAVLDGIKDLKEVVQKAKFIHQLHGKQVILFVDEIHRWNKAQQDALLPHLETGLLTLIGATTENPFYMLVGPLLSRCQLFELYPFNSEDVGIMIDRALTDTERGLGQYQVKLCEEAKTYLTTYAGGDIRNVLNALEVAVKTTHPDKTNSRVIGLDVAKSCLSRRVFKYDRTGDEHYHYISAYIKSMRGSDVDAALYWLSAMIQSGEDPNFIFRRLLIFASEDVGMADNGLIQTINSLESAYQKVGMPEGWYFLSHATIYAALAPKSNSTTAIFEVNSHIEKSGIGDVPNHLKDKTANKKKTHFTGSENPSDDYLYPHSYPNHWVNQSYLPEILKNRSFYTPGNQGHEQRYTERLKQIKKT